MTQKTKWTHTEESFLSHISILPRSALALMGAPPPVERDPQSSLLDAPEPGRREPVHTGENGGFQDQVVYKYSLESMASRGEFLKAAVKKRSEADLANFAERVSQCTGCKHNGLVIQFKPWL
jgi:hypothetical protein